MIPDVRSIGSSPAGETLGPTAERELAALAAEINEAHRRVEAAVTLSVERAIEAGGLLAQAKAGVPHGEWLAWIGGNCSFSLRTAQVYMRLHRHTLALGPNAQRAAHLSLRGAVKLLTAPRADGPAIKACVESADAASAASAMLFDACMAGSATPDLFAAFAEKLAEARGLSAAWLAQARVWLEATDDLSRLARLAEEAHVMQNCWADFNLRHQRRCGVLIQSAAR